MQILREGLVTAKSTDPEILPLKKLQQTLDIKSSEKDHEIELQNGRYIIASNSAFLQMKNKEFEKMRRIFKPGARIPNREKLAGPKLDELYEQEKKVTENLGKCNATLALDGWSTITNDAVNGISITAERKYF